MKSPGKALLWAVLPLLLLTPLLLWQGSRFTRQLTDTERTRTRHTLELHASAVQRSFDRIEGKLDSLTVFVAGQTAGGNPINPAQFNTFAEGLHASSKWIRAFQVVSNGIITHTYPLQGNEAVLGYNLLADPRPVLGKDVLRAQQTGRVTITGPIELVQGGLGLMIRKPLAQTNGAPARLAAIILKIAPLLDESGINETGINDIQLAIRKGSGEVFWGAPAVFEQEPVTHCISLPDGVWILAGCPLAGWQAASSQPVWLFYGGGAAVVLLLCALFFARARSEANLAAMVQERTAALRQEFVARQEAQEQFRLIMENLADMVVVLDLSGHRLYNSPSYGKILGDPGQLVGTSSFEQIHPDDRAQVQQVFQDTVRTGVGHRLQYRLVDQTGQARHIESQGSVIRDDHGQVAKVVVVSRDVTERQRIEQVLLENEARYRFLFEQNPMPMLIYERRTLRLLAVNDAFLKHYGYSAEEALALHLPDLYPADQKAKIAALIPQLRGHANVGEWQHRKRDGSFITIVVSSHDLAFDGHDARVAVMTDISERKQAEATIQRERDFSDAVLNSVPGVLYCYDEHRHFRRWNKNFELVTGYTAAEIAQLSPLDFFAGGDKALLAAQIQEVFEQGAAEVEADFVAKDGTRIPYYFTGLTAEIDGQRQLVGVGIDITERKRAEAALRESEERLRLLGDNLPDSYVYQNILEPDGRPRYLYLSAGVERIHAVPAEAILQDANRLHCQIAPEQLPALMQAEAASLRDLADFEMELRMCRADGQWRWLQVRSRPRKDFDGQIIWDGVATDVTARRQAEEEIQRLHADLQRHATELELRVAERTVELVQARDRAEIADQTKSAFLATMSHELRTPLNSIIGFTGIILQGLAGPLNAEQNKQLEMVRNSARHLLALINDVLDISKIEAGQLEIALAPFNLREAIEKVGQIVTPLAGKKHLPLITQIWLDSELITSDRRRVEQILLNLLSNAIKFTEHGAVTLTAKSEPGTIRISVTDTGLGIKPEDLDKLFQPFRQLDSGLSRQHEGTGLGLAICKRLVERLGGTITVASEWRIGSTFQFTLPTNRERQP